ncbi:MAG: hypothetical protein A2Y62_03850 [Candidatus Fischerbacteria bacterium RBG_13_37_8]|uniref:Glycosyltransferase subfamily 4-like N-terminal domain-containing protein n=1 Tax=Candidatus Fischerbacteria bacterium RBG_13_37_8 TaxID=1817863 RepID=A0A1F5V5E8_9BACT|nr:MAG: hypothetical protein A2Y62_03850 [Candidatus Fischerbacteria bacterium RBG_13_37_8]
MKLFYITPARIPTEKAHGFQITKMCESFARLNNEVTLIVPWRKNSKELTDRNPYDYYDLQNNFKIRKVWLPDVLSINRFFPETIQYFLLVIHTLAFAFLALFICLKHKPALIITRDSRTAFLLSFFMKVIYESHQFSRNKLERFFERSAYKRCKNFIIITQQLKLLYEKNGFNQKKLLVLPDGVDEHKFMVPISKEEARRKMNLPEKVKIVGYMGNFQTLEMEKGLIELIRCIKYIKDATIRIAMIGGPMSHVPVYLKIIENEGLKKDNYIFRDKIAFRDVPVALKAFDCCVMPFPWTEHYAYYMSPLKMFEYMASERPIITTDLPSVREILDEKSALFVPPSDEKALAEAIQKVLTDEMLASELAANALQKSREYGWMNRAKSVLELFSMNDTKS